MPRGAVVAKIKQTCIFGMSYSRGFNFNPPDTTPPASALYVVNICIPLATYLGSISAARIVASFTKGAPTFLRMTTVEDNGSESMMS